MLGSVTSVCLEGAYAHYHPEVLDILFWLLGRSARMVVTVSYTHLTLPTNREV